MVAIGDGWFSDECTGRCDLEATLGTKKPYADKDPKGAARRRSQRKAADMAGREIERLGDPAATSQERAKRKRRLIKGPREFRDVRGDLPKK